MIDDTPFIATALEHVEHLGITVCEGFGHLNKSYGNRATIDGKPLAFEVFVDIQWPTIRAAACVIPMLIDDRVDKVTTGTTVEVGLWIDGTHTVLGRYKAWESREYIYKGQPYRLTTLKAQEHKG
jgi:hypothetical protein